MLNRGGWNVREKRWGKQSYLATSREDKRSPYDSGILFYWVTVLTFLHSNRLVMSQRNVVCRHFFQFWLIFPHRNYKSCLIEYNFNWCWHHTLHLKKKTFPIFKNLLKSLGTSTKVLSCLTIPCPNPTADIDPHSQIWTPLPNVPFKHRLYHTWSLILFGSFLPMFFSITTQHSSVKVKKNSHFVPILPHVFCRVVQYTQ